MNTSGSLKRLILFKAFFVEVQLSHPVILVSKKNSLEKSISKKDIVIRNVKKCLKKGVYTW